KYTERGGVTVSWGESRNNDPERWMLCVHDTGPGFGFAAEAVSTALQEGTAEMREVEALCGEGDGGQCPDDSTHGDPDHASPPGDHDLDPPGISAERGEGVGLSIVKRLCDLLDASLEIESTAAQGSTFRVIFPRRFQPNVLGK
ncbi:MAG TPA: ATP-binding protein, partial [Pirellulales bacterium]